ncbi:hypothetical protein MMC28_005785 [Mycoblastus sanguinarius]|nr:hypothetical protein [Mycoblastus sanguinarius]
MASRGAFGFRSGKPPERADQKEGIPVGPSRRSSLTPAASSTSKLPTQSSSFFSRSKHSRAKVDASTSRIAISSNIPFGKSQSSLDVRTTRSEPEARPSREHGGNTGLGISNLNPITALPASKPGKQTRDILRRKNPLDQRGQYARTESSASSYEPSPPKPSLETASSPGSFGDPFAGSVLGVPIPTASSTLPSDLPLNLGPSSEMATSSSRMASFNTRKSPQALTTHNLPPPTPTFAHDSSSSTRRSESPGAFSRTSTPTSMSSQSPGVSIPVKAPLRTKQLSPTQSRPPVTRNFRRIPGIPQQEDSNISQSRGLPSVRESATSSSSSSTVKAYERRDGSQARSVSDRSTPLGSSSPVRTPSQRLISSRTEEAQSKRMAPSGFPNQSLRNIGGLPGPPIEKYSGRSESSQANRSRIPPPRPTRNSDMGLDKAVELPQTIHTHLPPLQNTGHKRQNSFNKDLFSLARPLRRSPSNPSSLSVRPSRMPSPNLVAGRPLRPTLAEPPRIQEAPRLETNIGINRSTKEPSPLSAGSSKSSNRFGLFAKRARSPLESSAFESAEKLVKKGPAAGTGHEGYGKYARRGRSGSASTSASRGRSTSSTSIGRTPTSRKSSFTSRDEPGIDDFLRDRLAPVVIPGGGHASDSPFAGSDFYATSNVESSTLLMSSEDYHARETFASQQYPLRSETSSTEPFGTHHLRRDHRKVPQRSESPAYPLETQEREGDDPSHRFTTLAARRSANRSYMFGKGAEPLKLPAPIDTQAIASSPAIDSRDTPQSTVFRTDSFLPPPDDISEGHEGNWLKSRRGEKRARSPRKWNFFQRAQASPRRNMEITVPRLDDDHGIVQELPAAVSQLPESRSVAFYALLDGSEQDGLDRIATAYQAEKPQGDNLYSPVPSVSKSQEALVEQDHRLSTLLPSPPKLTGEFPSLRSPSSPSMALPPPEAAPANEPVPAPLPTPKKPRLQQVGRIPRVISKRDRLHMPPPQSFSRPFARRPAAPVEPPPPVLEMNSLETFERPVLGIQTEAISSDPWGSQDSAKPASAPVRPSEGLNQIAKDEFLTFPPRVGSEVSGSSSSGILSFAATTAVVPEPGTAPEEDEIWNEYNEFLDTVDSPAPLANESNDPHEKTLAKGRWVPAPLRISKEPSVAGSSGSPERKLWAVRPDAPPPTRGLPDPPDRSKLLSSEFPNTPGTISDLLAGYGDRNRSNAASKRGSRSTTSRYSTSSTDSEADSLAGPEDSGEERSTQARAPKTKTGLDFQNNIRFDALMTSRWLSFNRVLFSPARVASKDTDRDRVLVLDGLANDDWPYYCAETYMKADIYNLSPTPEREQLIGVIESPKNYHHIQHANLGDRFPFRQGFFNAAVIRFPAASSEGAYVNAISECLRVLCPGGYLEMSILDLDMVNMGNRARKALRALKLRMQVAQPEVSLKPVSDNIQKLVGRIGFENLNRCAVNVPVAGYVSNSRSGSLDGSSESMADTMKGNSGKGDVGLAKNLPNVGRWWFTRCYESISMPYDDPERSIWADRALLEECEKKETGFKLLLCYAQKPAEPHSTSRSGSTSQATKNVRSRRQS